MELKPQLSNQLRGLRMSGVLETLNARERQAIDGQWSYMEFLSRLLEDETERRAWFLFEAGRRGDSSGH